MKRIHYDSIQLFYNLKEETGQVSLCCQNIFFHVVSSVNL